LNTVIIAEAGVNHNGNLEMAKKLIEVAALSGADFVKFQTFDAKRLVTKTAGRAPYQKNNNSEFQTQFEMIKKLELTKPMHVELIEEARSYGIGFLSTSFDIESTKFLSSLGQDLFKIPSGEITNLPYLRHVGGLSKSIFLSTGMSTLEEVRKAVEVLIESGTAKSNITVLHCTSSYPAPVSDVNLKAMLTLKNNLGVKIGYSDHTLGTEIALAAVVLGATVLEKHFTLDKNLPGPDHKASLEPNELKLMVSQIRNVEEAFGDGIKRPMPSEIENLVAARKSIVAKRPISEGEYFSEENLTTKRPGMGINPMEWDRIIGGKARRIFDTDEMIDEE